MANERISDLTPGSAPYGAGSLLEVAVPDVGSPTGYSTKSLRLDELVHPYPGIVSSNYDNVGVIPASTTTAGYTISSNYGGDGAVNYWNTVNSSGGHAWHQKTGASTQVALMFLYGDATYVSQDFYIGLDFRGGFYGDATGLHLYSTSSIPFILSSGFAPSLSGNSGVIVGSPFQYNQKVTAKTADFAPSGTLGDFEFGINYSTSGAAGLVIATLPSNAATGWSVTFTIDAAQTLRIQCPASHTIAIGAAVSAAAGKAESNTIGSSVTIVKLATNKFVATSATGTWTVT